MGTAVICFSLVTLPLTPQIFLISLEIIKMSQISSQK